jgi:FkbM family methyltransferase
MEYNFSEHQRWVNAKGDQTHRIDYPLLENSVVVDAGGYQGGWTETIWEKFRPNIHVLEPLNSYYYKIEERFRSKEKIKVYNYGLSSKEGDFLLNLDNDSSSIYKPGSDVEKVKMKTFKLFLEESGIDQIDLMKINIEGAEYELLEDIIEKGLQKRIKNIQVQFHVFIPDCNERRRKIRESLSETHECTYNYDFIWENWKIRE